MLRAGSVPALAVDVNAARHPISPYIYGINWYRDTGLGSVMHIPVRRWGGDNTTNYNWQLDASNSAADWYYENGAQYDGVSSTPAGQNSFHVFHETNLKYGTLSLGTISLMDWTPKSTTGCSFSVAKYGNQASTDPNDPDCGNGIMPDGSTPLISVVNTDPNDTYQPVDQTFAQAWMRSLIATYGTSTQGGIAMWSLDNEPEWWYGVHYDIYKTPATFDDMTARTLKWGQAVKAVDPAALITGPVQAGWSGMLYSRADMASGWSTAPYQYWDNPTDQKAHGNMYWIPYYLTQMQQFEQQNGYRLLDVLDVHGYISPGNLTNTPGDQAMETLRMTSTRALWDPAYIVPNTSFEDDTGNQVAPQLIPRMHQWVDQYYPNTQIAITEYMWEALGSITGAITQADILGIFGRESLDYGTLWGPPQLTDPGLYAFRIFLNYDGNGNRFGETSVSASTTDPDTLSIFAAQRSDTALTILVLNKTYGDITDSVSIANFTPDLANAQAWQYSSANLNAILKLAGATFSSSSINATFPALSMTLFVLPASQSTMTVPQPIVNWVKNAASWNASAIAPGEVVAIQGTSVGPAQPVFASSSTQLATSLGGVSVLFNGIPGAMIYTTPISGNTQQLAVVVPYEIVANPATTSVNVQVEVQGNSSDPFPMPVTTALPGLFTNDYSGFGQAAALNQDTVNGQPVITRNGPLNASANPPTQPATRGSYVLLYATGEGQTNPPGVDGRIATSIFPAPVLSCSVSIGNIAVTPASCGATPNSTAGELQVKAQVPMGVTPGNSVPVQVTIGNVMSPAGVTIAVQ
jgi:uncharacterized protein (TIGR03437 family)